MKKTILFIVLAALCLNFEVKAQNKPQITALKIGDQVPDITINNIINYKSAEGNPVTNAKISDFKGKAIIIDFWATWCAPCVKMIPKMDSLQRKHDGKLQFLSVSTQSAATVSQFSKRIEQQLNLKLTVPSVTDDRTLSSIFPYQYLPHYVWINKDDIVTNFTSFDQINEENIAAYLNGINPEQLQMPDVVNVSYDKAKPLFFDANGGEPKQIFAHSILSGYVPGLEIGLTVKVDSINGIKITARNQCIAQLFEIAYGYGLQFAGEKNVLFEVSDTTHIISNLSGGPFLSWLNNGNAFCYELMLPRGEVDSAYPRMRDDLKLFFPQYQAMVEKRKTACLVLKKTSAEDKIKSEGGEMAVNIEPIHASLKNAYLNQFTLRLDMMNSGRPVINATGYKGRVDLEINAAMNDFDAINRELKKYDLRFEREELEVNFLIIRDAPAAIKHTATKGGQP